MIKAPHKWRSTFIMTSFRWKLAHQMPLLISLRSGMKSQERKFQLSFLTFHRSSKCPN
ncbi:MAG: hypothetical protein HDR53_06675 [Treponema sp.]|nr:hypothetical protein [Treponema sp.]